MEIILPFVQPAQACERALLWLWLWITKLNCILLLAMIHVTEMPAVLICIFPCSAEP